jgi:hypothetical protein
VCDMLRMVKRILSPLFFLMVFFFFFFFFFFVLFGSGLWYRVKLMEGPADRRFKIHYLDFGNNEVRLETDFRPLPAALASVPPQVIRCRLALLRVPALVQDCGVEAIQALKELSFGRVLMASIEYKVGIRFLLFFFL